MYGIFTIQIIQMLEHVLDPMGQCFLRSISVVAFDMFTQKRIGEMI